MDIVSKEKRSDIMRHVPSKNTRPELIVRKYLHACGFRFRLHCSNIPGHPDIVLQKYKTLIEVRGCFWHGHKDCKNYRVPKSNVKFWKEKFRRNVERDQQHEKLWNSLGWNVIIVWECEVKQILNSLPMRIRQIKQHAQIFYTLNDSRKFISFSEKKSNLKKYSNCDTQNTDKK